MKIRTILAALVAAASITVLTPAAPANAQDCAGPTYRKISNIYEFTNFRNPAVFGSLHRVNLNGVLEYTFCPNGTGTNLVRPKNITWCWDVDPRSSAWQGVNFNAYIQDDNEVVNPLTFELDDNGASSRCGVQDIAAFREKWLEMPQHPRWSAHANVRLANQNDQSLDMGSASILPGSDSPA